MDPNGSFCLLSKYSWKELLLYNSSRKGLAWNERVLPKGISCTKNDRMTTPLRRKNVWNSAFHTVISVTDIPLLHDMLSLFYPPYNNCHGILMKIKTCHACFILMSLSFSVRTCYWGVDNVLKELYKLLLPPAIGIDWAVLDYGVVLDGDNHWYDGSSKVWQSSYQWTLRSSTPEYHERRSDDHFLVIDSLKGRQNHPLIYYDLYCSSIDSTCNRPLRIYRHWQTRDHILRWWWQ